MPGDIELDLDDPITKSDDIIVSPKGGGEGTQPEGSNSKAISADDLANLQKELQAAKDEARREREGRTGAETRAAEAERTSNQKLQTEVEKRIDEQSNTVDTALLGAQSEVDSFRALAAKAMEEGKWTEAAEANENLGDAKARLRDLTYQKQQLAVAKVEAAKAPKPAPASNVGARTASWIASHPRFNTDPEYNSAAMAAHYQALHDKVAVESDEYFKRIEEATGDRAKVEVKAADENTDNREGGKVQADGERPSGPAPVTRRAPAGAAPGPKKITLSGDEVERADELFGDPTNTLMYIKDPKERYTYWNSQKERLKADGRLG